MSVYYYKDVPIYFLNKIRPVRDPLDNFWNILTIIELINNCSDCLVENQSDGFDIAVFTKDFSRFLVRKSDGYFSMSNPFQVILGESEIYFNCDLIGEAVSGRFISIMKNAINTVEELLYSHDDIVISFHENFGMDWTEAAKYSDTFSSLIAEDHGYFRFDDDLENVNGDIHPRYHFDIFYRNSTSIKIGYNKFAELECFLSLFDKSKAKKYLT